LQFLLAGETLYEQKNEKLAGRLWAVACGCGYDLPTFDLYIVYSEE
jgi:hypothetical protein